MAASGCLGNAKDASERGDKQPEECCTFRAFASAFACITSFMASAFIDSAALGSVMLLLLLFTVVTWSLEKLELSPWMLNKDSLEAKLHSIGADDLVLVKMDDGIRFGSGKFGLSIV